MNNRLGWALALLATLIYSTNAPIARGAILAGMSPLTLLVARFGLASLLYGATLSAMSVQPARHGKPAEIGSRKLDRFGFWVAVSSGLLNGLVIAAFFTALETVSASISSMVSIALTQFFTLGLLALLGERLTLRNVMRLLVGLAGLYLLIGVGGSADPFGLLLIFVGAALFAVHLVSVQWFLKPYNTWIITTLIVVSATVSVLLLWALLGGETFVPVPLGWVAILFQGIITTYVGRVVTYSAINRIGSGQYALLSPLETALTILWAALFLGERLAPLQLVGGVLILLSTLLAADLIWHWLAFSKEQRASAP